MFDSPLFNVVIGLVFIYLLYSLFASAVQEALSNALQRRAYNLYKGVRNMLTNTPDLQVAKWIFIVEMIVPDYFFRKIAENNYRKAAPGTKGIPGSKELIAQRGEIINNIDNSVKKRLIDRYIVRRESDDATIKLYKRIYAHPIIKNYGQSKLFSKPSYLTDKNFSSILVDVIKNLDGNQQYSATTFQNVKQAFDNNKAKIETEVVQILSYHLNESGGDIDVFKNRVEQWFNDTMDRVSGWYKRNTHFWLFGIGLVLAVSFNINTFEIADHLSKNNKAAEELANMGIAAAGNKQQYGGQDSVIAKEALDSIRKNIRDVNVLVGLGWGDYGRRDMAFAIAMKEETTCWFCKLFRPKLCRDMDNLASGSDLAPIYDKHKYYFIAHYIWYKITWISFFGFLITSIAIGLGAPFWFDLLNKVASLRSTGKAVGTSGDSNQNTSANNTKVDG